MRIRLALAVAIAGAAFTGCGSASGERATAESTTVRGYGFELPLPPGWHGDVSKPEGPSAPLLRAATFWLGPATDIGQSSEAAMDEDDILITVADYGEFPNPERISEFSTTPLPVRIRRSDLGNFEGFRKPVATKAFAVDRHGLQVWIVFGSDEPKEEQIRQANDVLASLIVRPAA